MARYAAWRTIANREDSIRKFIKSLVCPSNCVPVMKLASTGFELYWQLAQLGSGARWWHLRWFPKKPGDRVGTDRRERSSWRAVSSGDLTAVWVPDENSEALRDLVRQREAAKQDQLRARHRLTKFLLRTGRRAPLGVKAWTECYMEWLQQIHFTQPAQEATLLDCMNKVEHMGERVKRLEQVIVEVVQLAPAPMQKVVRGLQASARRGPHLGSHDCCRAGQHLFPIRECAGADGV